MKKLIYMAAVVVSLTATACSDDGESAADATGLTTAAVYTDGLEVNWTVSAIIGLFVKKLPSVLK